MYEVLIPIDTEAERVHTQTSYVTGIHEAGAEIKATLLQISEEDIPDSPDSVPAIDQARSHLETEGIDVHVTFRVSESGAPAAEIVDVAEEIDADQIVMGGRKRTPAGKVLFGSVTQSVLLSTETPVTITGPL